MTRKLQANKSYINLVQYPFDNITSPHQQSLGREPVQITGRFRKMSSTVEHTYIRHIIEHYNDLKKNYVTFVNYVEVFKRLKQKYICQTLGSTN